MQGLKFLLWTPELCVHSASFADAGSHTLPFWKQGTLPSHTQAARREKNKTEELTAGFG